MQVPQFLPFPFSLRNCPPSILLLLQFPLRPTICAWVSEDAEDADENQRDIHTQGSKLGKK